MWNTKEKKSGENAISLFSSFSFFYMQQHTTEGDERGGRRNKNASESGKTNSSFRGGGCCDRQYPTIPSSFLPKKGVVRNFS